MSRSAGERLVVVCDDRSESRTPVVSLLTSCGFQVATVTPTFGDLPELLASSGACLVVVALPLVGLAGLPALRALRTAAPDCEVVLLAASEDLAAAAVRAGARALVREDDLRGLRAVLLELTAARPEVRVPRARRQSEDVAVAVGRLSTKPSA